MDVTSVDGRVAWLGLWGMRGAALLSKATRGRGRFRIARALSLLPNADSATLTVRVGETGCVRIPLEDHYWIASLASPAGYEPEIRALLRRISQRVESWSFVDGGANIGYWTVFAASLSRPAHTIVAVEPSMRTYERLLSALDGLQHSGVVPLQRALWSVSDVRLSTVPASSHESVSVTAASDGSVREHVLSVALDDLERLANVSLGQTVVLKLDVEGAEVAALRGAQRLLSERDVCLIYEDHGRDPDAIVTQYVLDTLGMRVVGWDDSLNPRPISTPGDAAMMKENRSKGYNFTAMKHASAFATTMR